MKGKEERERARLNEERIKREIYRKCLIDETQGKLIPYEILICVRILLCLIPQTGYIHPDEYFQSTEIVNSDILGYSSNRPWEFNQSFPVRSASVVHMLYGLPIYLWKLTSGLILVWTGYDNITPYLQLILPRLVMCFFSFINDYCLLSISYRYGKNYKANLVILSSSYVMLVYSSRTFSNTIELALFSLLLTLVTQAMARSEKLYAKEEYYKKCYEQSEDLKQKVNYHRLICHIPWHTFHSVFSIATIIVLGTFNRPTFLAFAFVPVFFWLMRGLTRKIVNPLTEFHMRSAALVLCALPTFALLVILDSLYYGYIDLITLFGRTFDVTRDFVVTPYNFILYNVNNTNLASHGLHCRLTHIFVNIPVLFSVLGVISILSVIAFIYKLLSVVKSIRDLPRVQSITVMITCSYLLPLVALSIFPHQEPRFLLPCLLPIIFLHSKTLRSKKLLLYSWYGANFLFTIYYAFIQQAGIYGLIHRLHKEIEVKPRLTHIHVVTTHSYPLPTSLLQLEYGLVKTSTSKYQKSKDFFTYELGSSDMEETLNQLQIIKSTSERSLKEKKLKYRLYLVLPSSLLDQFEQHVSSSNLTFEYEESFYPHLSVEALPSFNLQKLLASCLNTDDNSDTCDVSSYPITAYVMLPFKTIYSFFHQLGLFIVRVH